MISVCEPKTPELKLVDGEPGPGTGTCSRERASYEMAWGIVSLYHAAICIPPGPGAVSVHSVSIIKNVPAVKYLHLPGPGHTRLWLTLSFPRPGRMCHDVSRLGWADNGGREHINMWEYGHNIHNTTWSGLSTSTQGGNRHIWSWSLKTDRHLALWIVVISSKCDNTKRFNVTSLKASFDAGHAPGAW